MTTKSAVILTQENSAYQSDANTTPVLMVSPEVAEYMRHQTLPIHVFNRVMASRGEEEAPPADDAMFGTHLREALHAITYPDRLTGRVSE